MHGSYEIFKVTFNTMGRYGGGGGGGSGPSLFGGGRFSLSPPSFGVGLSRLTH